MPCIVTDISEEPAASIFRVFAVQELLRPCKLRQQAPLQYLYKFPVSHPTTVFFKYRIIYCIYPTIKEECFPNSAS
jgi:hypothetical protein